MIQTNKSDMSKQVIIHVAFDKYYSVVKLALQWRVNKYVMN